MNIVDIIGYLATTLVLSSFLAKSINLLRIINSVGCAVFVVYGIMLNYAWPIIITNGLIIVINVYFLYNVPRKDTAS